MDKENKCDKCPKTYSKDAKMKRHIWRAHEPIECMFCGTEVKSRQELKHHKEQVHSIKKTIQCKFALQGKCIDEDECLFSHIENEIFKDSDNDIDEESEIFSAKYALSTIKRMLKLKDTHGDLMSQ